MDSGFVIFYEKPKSITDSIFVFFLRYPLAPKSIIDSGYPTFSAQLMNLLDGVDGHVAGTGDQAGLAVEGVLAGLQHLVDKEGCAVAGGLGANQRTSEPPQVRPLPVSTPGS